MDTSVVIPIKPAFGAPCNGCGYCCQTEACELSRKFLDSDKAPCIALEQDGGRYYCGLVRDPGRYLGLPDEGWRHAAAREVLSHEFAFALRLGAGCDSESPQPWHGQTIQGSNNQ